MTWDPIIIIIYASFQLGIQRKNKWQHLQVSISTVSKMVAMARQIKTAMVDNFSGFSNHDTFEKRTSN